MTLAMVSSLRKGASRHALQRYSLRCSSCKFSSRDFGPPARWCNTGSDRIVLSQAAWRGITSKAHMASMTATRTPSTQKSGCQVPGRPGGASAGRQTAPPAVTWPVYLVSCQ